MMATGTFLMRDLTINLDRSSPVPLYHQLFQELEGAIGRGDISKGEYLDNELDLAETWRVSRPTVRRAIQELVDAGILVRRRGVGTQVVNAQLRRPVKLTSLYDDLQMQGRAPKTSIIRLERRKADKEVAKALGISRGDEVVFLERIRFAGRTPLAIMKNYLSIEAAGEITIAQLERSGLYELIRANGVRPRIANQVIGAKAASEEEAQILELEAGAPLLTMRRVMQDDLGRTVELGAHVYDAANYSVETTVVDN
jgi:DNA-binding GntR family transcriptional regulator